MDLRPDPEHRPARPAVPHPGARLARQLRPGPVQPDRPHRAGALPRVGRRAEGLRPDRHRRVGGCPGGRHAPAPGRSRSTTRSVTWKPQSAPSGVAEDATTAGSVLTVVAGGAGLAKTWLADPGTPTRPPASAWPNRSAGVGAVQNLWIARQTEMVRFAVDQAVAAGPAPRPPSPSTPKPARSPSGQPETVRSGARRSQRPARRSPPG